MKVTVDSFRKQHGEGHYWALQIDHPDLRHGRTYLKIPMGWYPCKEDGTEDDQKAFELLNEISAAACSCELHEQRRRENIEFHITWRGVSKIMQQATGLALSKSTCIDIAKLLNSLYNEKNKED